MGLDLCAKFGDFSAMGSRISSEEEEERRRTLRKTMGYWQLRLPGALITKEDRLIGQ